LNEVFFIAWSKHTIHLKVVTDCYFFIRLGGLKIAGEDDSWDFGTGAGFYVDATKEPYSKNYKMYSYITDELPKALYADFKELDGERVSITGHSMGGHGALTLVGYPLTQRSTRTC
jgi:S-formylglutathione hydrolase FrmB